MKNEKHMKIHDFVFDVLMEGSVRGTKNHFFVFSKYSWSLFLFGCFPIEDLKRNIHKYSQKITRRYSVLRFKPRKGPKHSSKLFH